MQVFDADWAASRGRTLLVAAKAGKKDDKSEKRDDDEGQGERQGLAKDDVQALAIV